MQAVQPEAGQLDCAELANQLVPGSFEYALNEIVEEHLDLSTFEQRYRNDDTGRLAYDPKDNKAALEVSPLDPTDCARGSRPDSSSAQPFASCYRVLLQSRYR